VFVVCVCTDLWTLSKRIISCFCSFVFSMSFWDDHVKIKLSHTSVTVIDRAGALLMIDSCSSVVSVCLSLILRWINMNTHLCLAWCVVLDSRGQCRTGLIHQCFCACVLWPLGAVHALKPGSNRHAVMKTVNASICADTIL